MVVLNSKVKQPRSGGRCCRYVSVFESLNQRHQLGLGNCTIDAGYCETVSVELYCNIAGAYGRCDVSWVAKLKRLTCDLNFFIRTINESFQIDRQGFELRVVKQIRNHYIRIGYRNKRRTDHIGLVEVIAAGTATVVSIEIQIRWIDNQQFDLFGGLEFRSFGYQYYKNVWVLIQSIVYVVNAPSIPHRLG